MPAVVPVAGATTAKGAVQVFSTTAGEAISEGQIIYLNGGSAYKADSTTAAKATVAGVATANAASGETAYYIGTVDMVLKVGASFTKNEWYILSGANGGIEQLADAASGEYVTYLGYGDGDGNLIWKNHITGQTKA